MKESVNKNLKWWVLITVMVGTFLGRIDQTIVNLALPKIINDFSITVNAAGWIATAYILANAVFVPIWGKMGDTIGRKKVYIIGFIVFIIGSVLAGLSWNLGSLVLFRIIQAIAGSADYPTAMAILAVTFKEGRDRAQALGIWSASFAAAAVFGPLIGGPLIDNFGWRSVFLVNLPVGIVGLFMAFVFVNESTAEQGSTKGFDWWGAAALGACLASLVLVLDKGLDWGWLSFNSLIAYAIAIIGGGLFYYIETNHASPIVDFKFFKNSTFVNTLLNNFISFMGMMGSIFLIPVFAQTFLGYDATQAGYLFIPMAVMMMAASPLGGALTGRVAPKYVIAVSTFISAVGLYFFTWLDPRSTALDIIIPLGIMAFGLGFGMAQRTSAVASAVPQNEIGIASSILALVRNVAGAFGIALFGTIIHNLTLSNVAKIAEHSTFHFLNPEDLSKAIGLVTLKAQIAAYDYVFLLAAILMFIGAIVALWIKADKNAKHVEMMVE